MKMLKSVDLLSCSLIFNPVFLEAARYFCLIGCQVGSKQNVINFGFHLVLIASRPSRVKNGIFSQNLTAYSCAVRDLACLSPPPPETGRAICNIFTKTEALK